MPTTYRTREGDVLDAILFRHDGGWRRGRIAATLAANIHLRALPPKLPAGVSIVIPDAAADTLGQPLVKLWD